MSNMDQIRALLDSIEKVGASGVAVDKVSRYLGDIASNMAAVAQVNEKAEWAQLIVAALANIKLTMPEQTLPAPVVNVAAPVVNLPPIEMPQFPAPPAPAPPTGWRMRITARDDLGRVAEITLKPEN